GFFNVGDQCFKLFTDSRRSWDSAKAKCQAEGLQLAVPTDPVLLGRHIVDNIDDGNYAWLGARGDNTALKWERYGTRIISGPSDGFYGLFHPGDYPGPDVTTSHCLMLLSQAYNLNWLPQHPFHSSSCSNKYYTLCEA
ncbi:unnamed protein product, partial [Meganyctiphanes norvegica]